MTKTEIKTAVAPLIVVYHAECIDGAASAWAVARAHGEPAHAVYIPYEHHDHAAGEDKIRSLIAEDARIYFVDVAPEKEFLDELALSVHAPGSIHVLDHHKSAAERLRGYVSPRSDAKAPAIELYLDSARTSAARMIWEHVLPHETPPPVLDIIDKMDGDAKGLVTEDDFAAAAYVDTHKVTTAEGAFEALRGLAKLSFNDMAQRGRPIAAEQEAQIGKLLAGATFHTLNRPDAPPLHLLIVNGNVQNYGRRVTERLMEAAKKGDADVALMWFTQKNGTVTASIRTDGDPDAGGIAEYLRETMAVNVIGGGHATAAAMHFPSLTEFAGHIARLTPKPAPRNARKTIK